jgi:hypothetical protein
MQFDSAHFFMIYVPSQQPQGQLQIQHSVNTGNYTVLWTTQYKIKVQLKVISTGGKHINAKN